MGWVLWLLFVFKQKTAYELRISDWSSDVCSSRSLGRMDQQRNVIALEPQLFVCRQHVRNLGDARVVVAKHDEDGVVVPAAFLRNLHQAADVEIQKADRVVLRHAAGTGALHL